MVTANFSPDGWRVVTASEDGTARLWNAINGEPLGEPMRHDAEVLGAQVSQDGQRIITVSVDGSARLWRADTGQLAAPPLRHADLVHWAAFSPDGHRAVPVLTAGGWPLLRRMALPGCGMSNRAINSWNCNTVVWWTASRSARMANGSPRLPGIQLPNFGMRPRGIHVERRSSTTL